MTASKQVVFIGNPPQEVLVDIDTGSSELWVNPNCATAKKSEADQCDADGSYNPDQSITPPQGPKSGGVIHYVDGSSVELDYYNDTVSLGDGATIPYQKFGVASASKKMSTGILGIGPDLNTGFKAHGPYRLVIDSLADEGIIQSRAYSLDLRHYDDPSGTIMYGGIDRGRYMENLAKLPIVPSSDGYWRLSIQLDSLGATTPEGSTTEYSLISAEGNVLLDTGTTMSYLHASAARYVLSDVGAFEYGGYYWAPCQRRHDNGTINFGFGTKTIKVPYADMIRKANVATGGPEAHCPVALIIVEEDEPQILGVNFLRASYVIFDWDNQNVHIAQAASCGHEEVVPISRGTDAVPSVTGLCATMPTLTLAQAGGDAEATASIGASQSDGKEEEGEDIGDNDDANVGVNASAAVPRIRFTEPFLLVLSVLLSSISHMFLQQYR